MVNTGKKKNKSSSKGDKSTLSIKNRLKVPVKSKPIKTTAHRNASQFTDDKRDSNFFF